MSTEFELPAAAKGLATEFSKSEQPLDYALVLENRFINLDGDAESRPGLSNYPIIPDNPEFIEPTYFTGRWNLIHEHTKRDGTTVLFSTFFQTQDSSGDPIPDSYNTFNICRFDSSIGYWQRQVVYNQFNPSSPPFGGGTLSMGFFVSASNINSISIPVDQNIDRPKGVQFGDKSVFVSQNIQPYYYDENFDKIYPLNSVIAAGTMTAGSSAVAIRDSNVSNWANETFVTSNDLLYNITQNSWAIITSVGTTELQHTAITSTGVGLGNTSVNYTAAAIQAGGSTTVNDTQKPGDQYEIWDLVENNFFPTNANLSQLDNVVVAASGTNGETVEVSSNLLTRTNTKLRPGDYIYNATRNSVQRIATLNNRSGNNGLTLGMTVRQFSGSATGQTSGDTLIFLKSAVPIASEAHVHYGRLYLVDAREKTRIYPSAPDDCRDFTTYQDVLTANTIDYGSRQPKGEEILELGTFQRYLVASGRRNIYLSEGVDPVAYTSGAVTDFQPVGLFTQGAVTRMGLANTGAVEIYIGEDGLRRFNVTDILAVDTDNASEVIKTEVRNALQSAAILENDIQAIHYPRRNWIMFKIGDVIYNFNYTVVYGQGDFIRGGSWSKFTGRLAQCHSFLLRQSGDILAAWHNVSAASPYTYFFEFDNGSIDDGQAIIPQTSASYVSQPINTLYETAWVGPGDGRMIHNRYIRPFLECDANVNFNISIVGNLETDRVDDTIVVSATGGGKYISGWTVGTDAIGGTLKTTRNKYPLRTYTDYFKLRITTSGGARNVINKFVLYGNPYENR